MVYRIINNNETVMAFVEFPHSNNRILRIMLRDIQSQLLRYLLSINGCCHSRVSLVEYGKNTFVYVVIYYNNSGFCAFNQLTDKLIGVKDLAIKEKAFYRG